MSPTLSDRRPSVSVVIPCYNAEAWVAECVSSCLNQTLKDIEIIVVDDGSTDRSREVLQQFDDRIEIISQPNAGGCAARNAGFLQSRGEFVQFLDADDYLLPDKIQLQRDYLIETGADTVYGDWRHQHHEPDQRIWLQEPEISGKQDDVLYSLLNGWWVSPAALLFRSSVVRAINGWDETLKAAQDRDFFTRVAMHSEKVVYQSGCHSIYRRYGNVTISTGNSERYFNSHLTVNEKMESMLAANQRLTDRYKSAIAGQYFHIARNLYKTDGVRARQLVQRCKSLSPSFAPQQSFVYDLIYNLAGFSVAEYVAQFKKQLAGVSKPKSPQPTT